MPSSVFVTADQLAAMSGGGDCELVRGKLVRVNPPSAAHGRIAVEVAAELRAFAKPRKLGTVMVESGYILERSPDTVRGPDVSFLRAKPSELPSRGYVAGGPELAVEIVSPDDTMKQLLSKAQEYLAAGSELVWIINPNDESARVVSPAGIVRIAREGVLDGGATLPGFALKLSDLFDAA